MRTTTLVKAASLAEVRNTSLFTDSKKCHQITHRKCREYGEEDSIDITTFPA